MSDGTVDVSETIGFDLASDSPPGLTAIGASRAVLGVPLQSGAAHIMPFGPVGVERRLEREDEVGAGCRNRGEAAILPRVCLALPGHDTSLHHTSLVGVGYATRSS